MNFLYIWIWMTGWDRNWKWWWQISTEPSKVELSEHLCLYRRKTITWKKKYIVEILAFKVFWRYDPTISVWVKYGLMFCKAVMPWAGHIRVTESWDIVQDRPEKSDKGCLWGCGSFSESWILWLWTISPSPPSLLHHWLPLHISGSSAASLWSWRGAKAWHRGQVLGK